MNPILESIYPDKGVIARRQSIGLAPLLSRYDPFTDYLHEEMRQCFLNGHDHAAIVVACALVDFAVKDAVYVEAFVKAGCEFNADEWDEIDGLSFGDAINRAKLCGVVSKKQWKHLEWIREHVRNVYMHGQTPHCIKDKDDTFWKGNLETGELTETTVNVRDEIVLQRVIRIAADRNICDQVVRLVDAIVRTLCARSDKAIALWKAKYPFKHTRAQLERMIENMRERGIGPDFIITGDLPLDSPPATDDLSSNDDRTSGPM